MKNKDINFNHLILDEKIKSRNGKLVSGIEKYLSWKDFNWIPDCVGIIHFQNWIIKNKVDIETYKDYMRMVNYLNYPLNEQTACPKNISAAHTQIIELFNLKKQEEKELAEKKEKAETIEKFKKRYEINKNLEMEVDGFLFKIPQNSDDLIREGTELHHCVGSYVEKYMNGETTILFIRHKKDPDKPLYTMEWKKREVVQVRSKFNQEPPKSIFVAIDKWEKRVLKGR